MRKLSSIIFWGALWGIVEATIGHFLHIWALPIGWLIWFPLAYCFMWAAYRQTGQPVVIFFTALVASSIKLIDLLMPVRIDFVINPAVSILLEGLAVFTVCKVAVMQRGKNLVDLWPIAISSILWRVFYSIYVFFLPAALVKISPVNGAMPLVRFLLFESTVNSLLIYGVFKLFPKRRWGIEYRYFSPNPALSLGILLIACFVQWRF